MGLWWIVNPGVIFLNVTLGHNGNEDSNIKCIMWKCGLYLTFTTGWNLRVSGHLTVFDVNYNILWWCEASTDLQKSGTVCPREVLSLVLSPQCCLCCTSHERKQKEKKSILQQFIKSTPSTLSTPQHNCQLLSTRQEINSSTSGAGLALGFQSNVQHFCQVFLVWLEE